MMKKNGLILLFLCELISCSFSQKSRDPLKDKSEFEYLHAYVQGSYPPKMAGILKDIEEVYAPSGELLYELQEASELGAIPTGTKRLKAVYLFDFAKRQTPYYLVYHLDDSPGQKIEITKRVFMENGEYRLVAVYTLITTRKKGVHISAKREHLPPYTM